MFSHLHVRARWRFVGCLHKAHYCRRVFGFQVDMNVLVLTVAHAMSQSSEYTSTATLLE